jgi:8-oxo-dGTP pyrophosphatase MutT (NUDIX family)
MGNSCPGCEEKQRRGAVLPPPTSAMDGATDKSEDEFAIAIPPGRGLDHILTLSRDHTVQFDRDVTVDFSTADYRAFCLLLHRQHGALLLFCTRKEKKPPHYQLPGGHVDAAEFRQVSHGVRPTVTQEQLYLSARLGCVREVYEETGIDLRKQVDRLRPMILHNESERGHLINELKHRLFFVCEVLDDDFVVAAAVRERFDVFCTLSWHRRPSDTRAA